MVHVSDILLTTDTMHENTDHSSRIEFLESKSKPRRRCLISFKKALLFIVCSTVSIILIVTFMYYFGPTMSFKGKMLHDLEVFLNHDKHKPFRLSDTVQPTHYRLRIFPNLETFAFDGRVSIKVFTNSDTNEIVLHSVGLNITSVELLKPMNGSETLEQYSVHKKAYIKLVTTLTDDDRMTFIFEENLIAGNSYLLDLKFHGKIGDDLIGFYRSGYYDSLGKKKWIATTHFQPIYARRTFPCFDEPKFKAQFQISIARRTNTTVLSNMPLRETELHKNITGYVWDHFMTTPIMSTYLVAFTISDFKSVNVSTKITGPVIRIWAPKQSLYQTDFAVNSTNMILNFYESYFKQKYTLPKLDLIAIPDFSKGAMENWGLISFRDSSLLLDNTTDGFLSREHVFNTLAHEIAHQWFGNLVTMSWWSDLWLNEGFATYMAFMAEAQLNPSWESFDSFGLEVMHQAFTFDSYRTSHNLHALIVNNLEIEQIFDTLTYYKSAAILRMLNFTIGQDKFVKGVRRYVEKWSFNSTSEGSLFHSFDDSIKENITLNAMMSSWTHQCGFPLITALTKNSSFTIIQTKFPVNTTYGYWVVPISYKTKNNLSSTIILHNNTRTVFLDLNQNWLLLNLYQAGYYRVNYNQENWDLLINQLEIDPSLIPASNQAQLIDDAFELASYGFINYEIPFRLIKYLSNETSPIPWKAALKRLSVIESNLLETPHYIKFREFMLQFLEPLKEVIGHEDETILSSLVIEKLCSYRFKPCIDFALNTFTNCKFEEISYSIRQTVYCTAVEIRTEHEWDYLWNQTFNLNNSGIKLRELYLALGCSRDSWIIYRYLNSTINGSIAPQNVLYVWRSISKNPIGRIIGLKFLEHNWRKIYDIYKDHFDVLLGIIEEFVYKLSNQEDLEKVTTFYALHKNDLRSVSGFILGAIEKISAHVFWQKEYLEEILQFIS
ncbi:PREDICTED: aminopeptidase N-like [Nicrophorus vespilloides]|uniref:Aminopeptidase n=1 Tax=Nicrophorus vespilloides TaxID=110193 RepID=A0ABM1MHT5_NICVS|nr:PREDICTED: aminopeptidase N-like [Nicrophorus vespilloides]